MLSLPFKPLVVLVVVLGAVMLWLVFAPARVGGSVNYVVAAGSSMAPHIAAGDLVLVRQADSYRPGDVVAYHNRELGRVVLHRIVSLEGGRYVMKGDVNSWVDSYQPGDEDILGRMWIRIPRLGKVLEWIRKPEHAAVVAGSVAAASGLAGAGQASRKRRQGGGSLPPASVGMWVAVISLAVVAAFVALAAVAFSRDEMRTVEDHIPLRHEGSFSYSAPAAPSPAYDGPAAVAGDPIMLALARRMNVGFTYQLLVDIPHQTQGRARLLARVGDFTPGGWKRTLELTPWQEFQGDEVRLLGVLDLGQVLELVRQVEQVTGVTASTYRVSLLPVVEVAVEAQGGSVTSTFSPSLDFRLDQKQMVMASPEPSPVQGAPSDPLRPRSEGEIKVLRQDDNTLSGLGIKAPVKVIRRASVVGGLVGMVGALLGGATVAMGLWGEEGRRIRSLYGPLLVPALRAQLPEGPKVWVKDVDALARLAQTHSLLIVDEEGPDGHRYLVHLEGVTYLYQPGGPPPEPSPAPAANELAHLRQDLADLRQELAYLTRELSQLAYGARSENGDALESLKAEKMAAMKQEVQERERRLQKRARRRSFLDQLLGGR